MTANNNAHEASIMGVFGATGTGKSMYIRTELLMKSDNRLAIWDYKAEYDPARYGAILAKTLAEAVRLIGAKRFRVIFRPSYDDKTRVKQFDVFCRAVWQAADAKVLIEELAFVTTPQRSPAGWKKLTCTGRSRGVTIIATSQRPAQVDKDFYDNCTELHTGFLAGKPSRKTIAEEMDIDPDEIKDLPALYYIHKNQKTKEITRGKTKINPSA